MLESELLTGHLCNHRRNGHIRKHCAGSARISVEAAVSDEIEDPVGAHHPHVFIEVPKAGVQLRCFTKNAEQIAHLSITSGAIRKPADHDIGVILAKRIRTHCPVVYAKSRSNIL